MSAIDMPRSQARLIEFDNNYDQSDFTWFIAGLIVSYTLMAVWFRLWQFNSYKLNWQLCVIAACSYLVIIITGILYTVIALRNVSFGV